MPLTRRRIVRSLAAAWLAGVTLVVTPIDLFARQQAAADKAAIDARLKRVAAEVFSRTDRAAENIAELKAILALDPSSAQAHMLLGIAYRTQGSPDLMGEAAGELRQALVLDPSLIPARLYLAHLYLDLARPERAREELQAALAQAPGQLQIVALLGEAERQLGNPTAALDLAAQALSADPSFAEARYYQAQALHDLGRRDEALRALEQVVQSGGRRPEVFSSLGGAYLDAGRLDDAVKSLSEGLALDASRPDLLIQLARAYRLKGQLVKADAQLTRLRSMANTTAVSAADQQMQRDFFFEEGLIRLQQRQLAAAGQSVKKAVDIDPNYGPGYRYLAEIYLRQGLYTRARDQATRAEKLGAPLPPDLQKTLDEKLRPAPPKGRE